MVRGALRAFTILAGAAALWAQAQPARQPAQQAPHQPAGMLNPWEMAPVMEEISGHGARLAEALGHINVRPWIDRGASETYLELWQSASEQAKALADTAGALARNPEKLSAGLDVLFRIQALETMTGSLEQGLRKYQTPAAAAALAALSGENGANRSRLERYLVSLAADQEQQLQVMDSEAQRCRASLSVPSQPSRKR
ncbi:MAG: hypothetical protein ABSH42_18485 [Bryobacteraceae bacterium]|jgi:hypothetical protein